MATFEIEILTQTGSATVYTDDITEFVTVMSVSVTRASRSIVGLPKLAGYRGPIATGRVESDQPVLRYEDERAEQGARQPRYA
jgi:hypothetical protein